MFSHHVTRELSAYCNGELSPEESSRVAEHLIRCRRCRSEHEVVRFGVSVAERIPLVQAPESLWSAVGSGRTKIPSTGHGKVWGWRRHFAAVAASLVLVAGLAGLWLYTRESRPFWQVARIDGTPRIGREVITKDGRLPVGEWLETDASSRAKIDVATIGQVEIDPNTRVRLLETKATEHRLELLRGRISAYIWAPPRLFFVDTPSAVAADLGCAYTLEVDDEGSALVRVTAGWVALELRDRESMVPSGAACATRPGIGPGTPYFEDASPLFRQALTKFDFEPTDSDWSRIPSLDLMLAEARPRDTLTLWHLLSRVEGKERERVYDRMVALVPAPAALERERVLRLDEYMLEFWKDELTNVWTNESFLRKKWIKVWTKGLGKIKGGESKK